MRLRIAIYARVSSAAQRDAHTIDSQLHALRPFVQRNGWDVVGEYIDDGLSAKTGRLAKRLSYAQLLGDVGAGKVDAIVTAAMDRLTRTEDLLELAAILGPLQRAGVRIISPTTGEIDLRSEHGPMIAMFHAHAAALENARRAARVKAGKLRAIAEGRKPAGPTPYGLAYDRARGTWSLDEPRAAIVREIFRRVIAGESCAVIAEDLYVRNAPSPRGVWERHKVWAIASSRTYVGEWIADKRQRLAVKVPPIVDEAVWQAASDKMREQGKRGLVRTKHVYLLEGLAVCSRCGSPIGIRSGTKDWRGRWHPPAYVCRARKIARLGEPRCDAPIALVADTDARVWERIAEALVDPELAAAIDRRARQQADEQRSWQTDADEWRRKLARLDKHEAAVLARFRRDQISEAALDVELAAVARERTALRAQLETAERAAIAAGDVVSLDAWVAALRELGASGTPAAQQRVVRALVRRGAAILDDGRVKLTLRVRLAGSPPEASCAPVLVVAPGCSTHHGTTGGAVLRIRLVA